MGKNAIFSHLPVSPIPPFIPYLCLLSLLLLLFLFAFYPSLLFFALYAAAHRMNPKCSYGVFTKSSDFSGSRGEWRSVAVVVVVGCGDISKAAFSCRYLATTTLPSLSFFFPHSPPPSCYPSVLQSSVVLE